MPIRLIIPQSTDSGRISKILHNEFSEKNSNKLTEIMQKYTINKLDSGEEVLTYTITDLSDEKHPIVCIDKINDIWKKWFSEKTSKQS